MLINFMNYFSNIEMIYHKKYNLQVLVKLDIISVELLTNLLWIAIRLFSDTS